MRGSTAMGMGLLLAAMPLGAQSRGGQVTEIPLRVVEGRFVVPVNAGGEDVDFILSTGTAVTVFSESGARLADAGELSLGGIPVNLDNSQTIPDEGLTLGSRTYAGMVGVNTLNRHDILVDAPGGRLLVKPVGDAVDWEGFELSDPVRLQIFHGVVLGLEVELNGRRYPAMLDLGTPTLIVNQSVIDEAGISDGTARTLTVGGATVDDVPTVMRDLDIIRRFSPTGAGFVLLGSPLAQRCALSISWIHAELRTCVR